MISLSPYGAGLLVTSFTDKLRSAHLFVDDGEMKSHGYAPRLLTRTKWQDGNYPSLVWEFVAGDPVNVLGYFVSDKDDKMIFSELFDEPFLIQHNGDRITVDIKLTILGKGV